MRQRDEDLTRRLVPCECFVSRSISPPSEKAPTVEDLERELVAELGRVRPGTNEPGRGDSRPQDSWLSGD